MSAAEADRQHMLAALALARRALGQVAPNPAVGCVLVAPDGLVVGRGSTGAGGRPHAETIALDRAGARAKGATAYVTLEPCAHQGMTPPCTDALIAAGVARVVYAVEDPDPRVQGRGDRALREAGLAVDCGLLGAEARALNAGFFHKVSDGRPLVTLKLATSLDGRIATAAGDSQWITGPLARARAHLLRAGHDAVAVGANTAVVDNPALTVRLPGLEARQPLRAVFDGRLRLPLTHKLVTGAREVPTLLFARPDADAERAALLEGAGVELVEIAVDADGAPDLDAALGYMAGRGLTRLLVEGGGRLAASLLAADLVDRIAWFHAPLVIGGEGIDGVGGLGLRRLTEAPRFELIEETALGPDRLLLLERLRES